MPHAITLDDGFLGGLDHLHMFVSIFFSSGVPTCSAYLACFWARAYRQLDLSLGAYIMHGLPPWLI